MRMVIKSIFLLALLAPSGTQAQQRPVWLTPTLNFMTYSGDAESSSALDGMGLSINIGGYSRKAVFHQVAISASEEITLPLCFWACWPTIPDRLYTFSYTLGIGRSSRFYVANLLGGPALVWGNGRVAGKKKDNWPFHKAKFSLRMHMQAHVMPLRYLGLGAHMDYLPIHSVFGWGIGLIVRIYQSPYQN